LDSLPKASAKAPKPLIAKLSALPVDQDEDRKLKYRHGILAFER
jgi:hypothetical protein